MSGKKRVSSRERRLCSMREGLSLLFSKPEQQRRRFLTALWENWPMILGQELSALAFPLGHKDDVLRVGAEDTMAMQELSLQSPEILERVNAFMDCEFFSRVKVELLLSQRTLSDRKSRRPTGPLASRTPPRPPGLGGLRLDAASPVAACYAAYVRMYDSRPGA